MSEGGIGEGGADIGIRFEVRGRAGIITLDRPRALNALTHEMIRLMLAALASYAADEQVQTVVVHSSSERAFCAGGDVRHMAELARSGQRDAARAFWRDEYTLNHATAIFPKPYVSLVDGYCFGGGFGISGHGRYRVAGERLGFAMPEVAIGLFPDVGATHVLPRLPGWSGTFLALTGARIGMPDAMALGLYTHHVPVERWPDLIEAFAAGDEAGATLDRFAVVPPEPTLGPLYAEIDRIFAGGTIPAIVAALEHAARGTGPLAEFAAAQLATIRRVSPTSVFIAFEQMARGGGLDLAACLVREFRVVSRVLAGHDFYEGVRAVLIDKDQTPRWTPDRLEAVDPATIAPLFDMPLPDELVLPTFDA
ncbi:enoyl-CoA hydratase/isomerase family protein [Ancylobacter sp. 6x-1]|uniref:3-hydroxyisobutyryl-CoA hydrolase n=1 Tax=Ancylobacter crimeensis TaxID=2579147 RepID=A0ABT0D6W5_9HYPH|nr:enoyl-CoA hydratase/isomerase family protein [Ancylobacter crimeensis]MCK0195691.1 enoyl-CoA hydratase/isomerase family protein [Ancylobacter crimeensis]